MSLCTAGNLTFRSSEPLARLRPPRPLNATVRQRWLSDARTG